VRCPDPVTVEVSDPGRTGNPLHQQVNSWVRAKGRLRHSWCFRNTDTMLVRRRDNESVFRRHQVSHGDFIRVPRRKLDRDRRFRMTPPQSPIGADIPQHHSERARPLPNTSACRHYQDPPTRLLLALGRGNGESPGSRSESRQAKPSRKCGEENGCATVRSNPPR